MGGGKEIRLRNSLTSNGSMSLRLFQVFSFSFSSSVLRFVIACRFRGMHGLSWIMEYMEHPGHGVRTPTVANHIRSKECDTNLHPSVCWSS